MHVDDKQTLVDFPQAITDQVKTPAYLISEEVIERNCRIIDEVQNRTGAKILLALKAFALPPLFPLIRRYLHGVCASGPIEARLGREEFGREVHTYAPAYTSEHFQKVLSCSDYIIFNSFHQLRTHTESLDMENCPVKFGIRVNPGYSEVDVELYNPCIPGSRFGVSSEMFDGVDLTYITGLHFHALCEQNADVLERVLEHFEERFGHLLERMSWVNFGGGHHITRDDYDIDHLVEIITAFRKRHNNIDVFLEPGEAVVLNGGVFVTSVVDIVRNNLEIGIVDGSAETHLPDVLAMPYRPHLVGSGKPGEFEHTYRLGGISCLAGDVFGDFSLRNPLQIGQRLVFTDMALYTFVKNTTFNGVELPSIYIHGMDGARPKCVRSFGYDDYKTRIMGE